MQILTANFTSFRWQGVQNSTSQSDLPARTLQAGTEAGRATFICRVSRAEGIPGHLYEAGLVGSLSYPRVGDPTKPAKYTDSTDGNSSRHSSRTLGWCRVETSGKALHVEQDYEVMVAARDN